MYQAHKVMAAMPQMLLMLYTDRSHMTMNCRHLMIHRCMLMRLR